MGVSEQSFRDDSDSGDFCGDNYEDAVLSPRGLLHADQDFFASDYFNCLSALLTDTKNEHGRSPMDPQCCSDLIRPIRKKKKRWGTVSAQRERLLSKAVVHHDRGWPPHVRVIVSC